MIVRRWERAACLALEDLRSCSLCDVYELDNQCDAAMLRIAVSMKISLRRVKMLGHRYVASLLALRRARDLGLQYPRHVACTILFAGCRLTAGCRECYKWTNARADTRASLTDLDLELPDLVVEMLCDFVCEYE